MRRRSRRERLDRRGDIAVTAGLLAQREQGAPDPDDAETFGRAYGIAVDGPDIARPVGAAQRGTIPDEFPGRGVGLQPFAKELIFAPRTRHHGDEAPARAVDETQVIVAAELGIGDVEKIGAPGHGAQRRPGLDMRNRIVGVAVGGAKLHRYAAIGIGGEDEQQLLQIRAVVLRVAISDRRCALAGPSRGALVAVLTTEGNRGAVVMQLLELHGKALRHCQHDLGQQRRPIGLE